MSARKSTDERKRRTPLAVRAATAGPRSIWAHALLLAALLILGLTLAPRAEAYVYWTDAERGTIGRANPDGKGVDHNFVTGTPSPDGVAVNSTHVHWVNSQMTDTLTIGRARLDGTGANPSLIAGVEGSFDSGLAIDEEHVYWVSKFGDGFGPDPNSGAIGRANLDGTGVDESFITGLNFPAGPLAVEASHLYWTSYAGTPDWGNAVNPPEPSMIGRADLDGTGVEESFITAPGVTAVTVDDAHVWWTAQSFDRAEGYFGAIWRANLDGTGAESVIPRGGGSIGANFSPCGIAVDDTHVHWRGSWRGGYDIGRARLEGARANHEFIGTAAGCSVAVDGLPFSFGNVKRNRRRGTAKLTINVPSSGELELAKTRKVKGAEKRADAEGSVKLPVKPKGKARNKLARRGKARVKAKVSFAPDEGEAGTLTKPLKLVKRR